MRTYAEIDAELTKSGGEFEIETVEVDGHLTRVWKRAPGSLITILEEGRRRGAEADFIVHGDERISHEAHYNRVAAFACYLRDELEVRKGDRVAIAMRNLPEWSIAFYAALAVGGVAVALNAWWTGEELAFGLEDCGARVLIADEQRLARLAPYLSANPEIAAVGVRMPVAPAGVSSFSKIIEARAGAELPASSIHPDDSATIFYTSGTTSHPKGVLATHRNICSNIVSVRYTIARAALRDGRQLVDPPMGVRLLCVPLFHATGAQVVLQVSAFLGAKLVFMHKWDAEAALELMAREGVSQLSCVPTMLWDVLNAPNLASFDLTALKTVGTGGAASPPELVRRLNEAFPGRNLTNGYGLTESSAQTTGISGADFRAKPDSVGLPMPVCDLQIVDEAGRRLPPGTPGEIWIRGPNVARGYWRRPEATAETFVDGWLHSGDIGKLDKEGFLYIVDRAKDIIIRGGENISSSEVEAALFEDVRVLEAAVLSVPHATLGEEVGAVVRVRDGQDCSPEDLQVHLRPRLAAFKVPSHIWFYHEPFPRNASGKIQKRALREIILGSGN